MKVKKVAIIISFLVIGIILCKRYSDYKQNLYFNYMVESKLFYLILIDQEEKRKVKLLKKYIVQDLTFDLKNMKENNLNILDKKNFCKKVETVKNFFNDINKTQVLNSICNK